MFPSKNASNKAAQRLVVAMLAPYLASLVLPVGFDRAQVIRGYEFFLLGGVLQLGLGMLPANVLFLLGLQAIIDQNPMIALACGLASVVVGYMGARPIAEPTGMYLYPAFWFWIGSFLSLVAYCTVILFLKARSRKLRNHRKR